MSGRSGAHFGDIATEHGNALTPTYGDATAGWTTKAIDVSDFEKVTVEGTLDTLVAAGQLDMLVLGGDRLTASLDDFVRGYEKDATSGLMDGGAHEFSFDLADPDLLLEQKFHFCFNVSGLSMIRIAARLLAGSANLSLRYNGFSPTGIFQTPDVT